MSKNKSQSDIKSGILIPFAWKKNSRSIRVLSFGLITLTAIIIRLYISFSHNLILGMDGGYYPLQVRNILNTGLLGFNDVPLYFYFCAFIVKVLSMMGLTVSNEIIITVVKIVDSVALPLLAIPMFKMIFRKEQNIPLSAGIALLLFAILSFTPFMILGDLQKNAFAFPFAFIFMLYLEDFIVNPDKRNAMAVFILLTLIALSHFGVFTFCLVFLILLLFVVYRKNAILPSVAVVFVGYAIVLLFDHNRAFRLITFWKVIFERPALLQGPLPFPVLLNLIFSCFLAILGIFQFRKYKGNTHKVTKTMVISLIVAIFIFAFPFYEMQYVQRFNVLLLVPQILLVLNLIRMNPKLASPLSISLVLLTTLSIFMYFSEGKKPIMDDMAFQDLQNISKYLPENKENSIIIATHGLEFWTSLALNVRVGQDRAIDKIGLDKYSNVIFLQQKNEERQGSLGRKPFRRPKIGEGGLPPMGPGMGPQMRLQVPENFKLIYSSPYFNAYQKLN